jgi:hypothetical protein
MDDETEKWLEALICLSTYCCRIISERERGGRERERETEELH